MTTEEIALSDDDLRGILKTCGALDSRHVSFPTDRLAGIVTELLALRAAAEKRTEASVLAAVTAIKNAVVNVPSGPFMEERLPISPMLCTLVRDAIRESARALSHPEPMK